MRPLPSHMDSSRRWPRSTPWPRVWPAAVLVLALHAAALHGWIVSPPGLQRLDPAVTSIAVRILAPLSPSPRPTAETATAPLPEPAREPTAGRDAPAPLPSPRALPVAAAAPASSVSKSSAPAMAAPPASDYLTSSRLDPGPQLLDDVEPVYPAEAGHTEGSVVLRLLIGTSGSVDEVVVVRSQPKGMFERSAVAAFSAARFSPGKMLGIPVKSQLTIEVHFTPFDRGGNVSPPTY
jgi:periplasmic protein TonB